MRITHVAIQFGAWCERGHGVDHDHIKRPTAHQRLRDREGFFARAGLRDEQVIQVDANLGGIAGIHGVFGIDKGRQTARLLGIGNNVTAERGLPGGFGTKDLYHASARDTANTQGQVE